MKILHTVETYIATKCGMSEVVKQLSERLVKMGHDVTVATSKHSDRTESVSKNIMSSPECRWILWLVTGIVVKRFEIFNRRESSGIMDTLEPLTKPF